MPQEPQNKSQEPKKSTKKLGELHPFVPEKPWWWQGSPQQKQAQKEGDTVAFDAELESLFKEAEEARTKRDDSLTTALENLRAQEMHTLDFGKAMQDMHSSKLKNDKAVLDMEITKAEAVQQGLAVPQDPQSQAEFIKASMQGVKWPSDGKVMEYMLTGDTEINPSQGIMDAITGRINFLNASGQRSREIQSEEKKFSDYLIQEMQTMLKRADEEKHLSMTPFGPAGGFLGGFLDIISGPLDLGTELFGGRMSSAQKVEMLGRVYSQTSPIVRAQLNEVLGRDRMEMTHERWLQTNGLGSMTSASRNMDDANKIISTTIDIYQSLANSVPDSWGSDATTGIKQAFDSYNEIHKLLDDLREATTQEQALEIGKQIVKQDIAMREPIRQFLSRGGTPEQIHQIIVQSVDKVNEQFQQPLKAPLMGDSASLNFTALQKATAHDFVSKLGDFEVAILQNIPIDLEANAKKRVGKGNIVSDRSKWPEDFRKKVEAMEKGEPWTLQGILDRLPSLEDMGKFADKYFR